MPVVFVIISLGEGWPQAGDRWGGNKCTVTVIPGGPLVQYDASGNRTWMIADERGSIVALANDSAGMTAINTYDEYGIPGASNAGAFQYTGMLWLSRAGLYAPTFRAYGAHLGRFSQTDPIGMAGGINLYAYVLNDPVNDGDPRGTNGGEGGSFTCEWQGHREICSFNGFTKLARSIDDWWNTHVYSPPPRLSKCGRDTITQSAISGASGAARGISRGPSGVVTGLIRGASTGGVVAMSGCQ